MRVAITRPVPPTLANCELTHLAREPIDVARAEAQHAKYESLLEELGCVVRRLPLRADLPDSVFVEDAAIVLDTIVVITIPGAASRRAETEDVADALGEYRELAYIEAPGTVDGGDVLRVGGRWFVGRSSRTNDEGIRQLRKFIPVEVVDFRGCLHLKSAITAIGDDTVIINPAWVDPFGPHIAVHSDEPFAANVLLLGEIVVSGLYPRTVERLERARRNVRTVDASELAKAEGGVTCCSIIV
ncbi:MAG: dimethylargininase [Acidobacteriota bacterium]